MSGKRHEAAIMGTVIGTCTGWDGDLGEWIVFYEFIPVPELADVLGSGDLNIDFEKGEFQKYDDEGDMIWYTDALPVMMKVYQASRV